MEAQRQETEKIAESRSGILSTEGEIPPKVQEAGTKVENRLQNLNDAFKM